MEFSFDAFVDELSKIAMLIPVQPGAEASPTLDKHPHGMEGRLKRPPLSRPRVGKTEGPRAYAPRI